MDLKNNFLRIERVAAKKLIGQFVVSKPEADKTFELWSRFMPRRNEIHHRVSNELISMQIYDKALDFTAFTAQTLHEKWALAEVSDVESIPAGMHAFRFEAGLYAVFLFKGLHSEFEAMFRYIFFEWLPASDYELDQRPHFEVLGEKFNRLDPDSEEEIYIPVKKEENYK